MRVNARVYFYPPNTQLVDPNLKNIQQPVVNMTFKSLPAVGHIIEAPNSNLAAPFYRVSLIGHSIHGDIIMKVIPV